ncbi:MAG: hypothetical protein ACTHOR_01040 [Devosia sp.]
MNGQIYKAFRVSFTEAWYQLSKAEQDRLLGKVRDAIEKVGGKSIALCDSSWSSEEWLAFGVEVYPDMAAAKKHTELLAELNWFRYCKSSTLLGTPVTM